MHTRALWRRTAALTLSLALVATACGGGDEPGDDETTTEGGGEATETEGEASGELTEAPGFDGETITLGVITPTTGATAVIGNPLTAGNQARVDRINANGGIAGQYPVELVVEDSQYDAPTAVQKYTSMKDDVTMFAQILGTPVVNALTEQLANDNVVAQPASLDSFWIRNQNLLPVGAPYQVQAINALDWWINQEGNADSVVCWAGHDDPYGDAGLEGLTFAAEQMGVEIAAEVAFSSEDTTPESQAPNVGRLADAGCEFVFLTATPSPAGALLGAAAGAQFAPTWAGQSPTWVNALADSPLAPYLESSYHVMTDGAEWGDESVEGMAELLEDAPDDQQADIYFVFGYAAMMAVEQVLEAGVEAGDLSREGVVEAMNGIDTIEFGGLFGDYEWGPPEERVPPRVSRVFGIDPDAPDTGFFAPVTDQFASDAAEAFEF